MPKMKPHNGARKRFRVTGSGKLMRERANRRHYLEHKSSRYKRRLKPDVPLAKSDVARIRRMLGI